MKVLTTLALIGLLEVSSPAAPSSPSPVEGARALVQRADTEALFLQYGSLSPEGLSREERALVAAELLKGARLAGGDAFIAHGLLGRALILREDVETLIELARVEVELQQKGGAIEHLERALALDAKNARALMARGDLAFGDGDLAGALSFFERAQRQRARGARAAIERVKKREAEEQRRQALFQKSEAEIQERLETARREAVRDWLTQIYEEEKREASAPGGVRKQETQQFAYAYTAGRQTQGEMNQFERRIGRLLDKAYAHVSRALAHRLAHKIPVLLMTREEYAAKFASQPVARAGAFWNGQHIVVNGQTEVDERFAEVMVHELTHAFVQDLIGQRAAIPRWANEGLAEYMENSVSRQGGGFPRERWMFLKQLKKRGRLPPLGELDFMFAQMTADVQIAYVLSSYAVHLLIESKGLRAYVEALREMRMLRNPAYFDRALEKHLRVSTKWLEKEMAQRL